MSINIITFLGPETDGLHDRFIQAFDRLGFRVQLHPELRLTESPPGEVLYLSIIATPPQIRRLEPDAGLLVAFGYGVSAPGMNGDGQRARKGGKGRYGRVAVSRTSAGRSPAAGAMQMLVMAILARESGGKFRCDGDQGRLSGEAAVEVAVQQLSHFEKFNFDAYAHRFESWPVLDGSEPFAWPPEIIPPAAPTAALGKAGRKRRAFFRYKFSWFHVPGIVLFTYFLVVTLLYS